MEESLLFIRPSGSNDFIYSNMKRLGYNIENPYYGNMIFFRILREIWFRLRLPFISVWYNKKIIRSECKTIIIFDPLIKPHFLRWMREKHPKSRLIFFYGNPVSKAINPSDYSDICCEKWSWNEIDCETYGMKYNSGYYFEDLKVAKSVKLWDVVFIGRDKGRASEIFELQKCLSERNITSMFYITADRLYKRFTKPYYKKYISYDQIRKVISSSSAILDFAQEGQTGTTMRTMESIFNEIKLITNNHHISEFDFYDSTNIFILGKDNINKLKEFINSPYKTIDKEIIAKYEFANWLKRIIT